MVVTCRATASWPGTEHEHLNQKPEGPTRLIASSLLRLLQFIVFSTAFFSVPSIEQKKISLTLQASFAQHLLSIVNLAPAVIRHHRLLLRSLRSLHPPSTPNLPSTPYCLDFPSLITYYRVLLGFLLFKISDRPTEKVIACIRILICRLDGGDVRWYFSKVPMAENELSPAVPNMEVVGKGDYFRFELAPAVPNMEVVGKGDYFRFGMRDSLAIEASFLQVWDAVTGAKQYTFEGHKAPVYSVCSHFKENIQFIFSTATDGKIKAWLYDNMGSRVDYDAPGHSSTTMTHSADGTSEGAVKRTYNVLGKRSVEVVRFDTTKSRFLAAGDEFMVKFWDMDNVNLLTTTDADGGLPASPCIRFNKEGILMAVTTNDNGIKILANPDGIRLLRTMENRPIDPSRVTSVVKPPMMSMFGGVNNTYVGVGPSSMDRVPLMPSMMTMNGENRSPIDVKPRIGDEGSKNWKLIEITEPSQCRSLRLPDTTSSTMQVSRLIYTNSGLAILALAANAVHKLWKWQRTDNNSTGKATANVIPQLWQPTSGILMTNDVSETNPEDAVPCFALYKNDSYVMSASGGKISLFNMITFKKAALYK
ncbi:hypothetical protein L2E82_13988 [Cichorium intybus]|uniref:Uncharacterized protein n=1 Tax=Cichorium intybus TaxID=13427 RepID=A0ACB9EZ84_CICIN|nr:hypothetical protein L2E82_13988 [Cichorium intybus]